MKHNHREIFYQVWCKHLSKQPLKAFEKEVLAVLVEYPEYVENMTEQGISVSGGRNPYIVLGAHMALNDQIKLDRPQGIRAIYSEGVRAYGHERTKQLVLEVLIGMLESSYSYGEAPSEAAYLGAIDKVLAK